MLMMITIIIKIFSLSLLCVSLFYNYFPSNPLPLSTKTLLSRYSVFPDTVFNMFLIYTYVNEEKIDFQAVGWLFTLLNCLWSECGLLGVKKCIDASPLPPFPIFTPLQFIALS